jgi:HSP20 family protein
MALPILRSTGLPAQRGESVRDTALSAWNPWQQLSDMNRWFDAFMGRSFGISPQGAFADAPAIDLYESPDGLALFTWLPGAKRDAFDVSVRNDVITIRGERQPLIEGEQWTGYGSGFARAQGTFEASYRLPVEVDADKVHAAYHDGVLEIRLPKAETARIKSVKVTVEG